MMDAAAQGPEPGQRLIAALDALAARPVDMSSELLDQLAMDAALARAAAGEMELVVPRLARLLVGGGATIPEAVEATVRLGAYGWDTSGRQLIDEVLEAWWEQVLHLGPGEHSPGFGPADALGILADYEDSMVRWFDPWLTALDGAGAVHLVDMVVDGLGGPAWDGKADKAAQVLGWARTEPVVTGLTMIGGVHVDPERFSVALDRLI